MMVGRFAIRARLGAGGMGEVYLADDTKLKRSVALKRIAPRLRTDPNFRQRFLKEAERASALSDQRIAGVYDVLEQKDETFLVMEYVEGSTLRDRLGPPFSLEQFLPVALQCAEALVAAHDKGVVHRDIKPENIMLTPKGQVKILDFGVAKRLPRPGEQTDSGSAAGGQEAVAGTPAYMAPEVLLEKDSDQRADIFSLGVVFYEMLAGKHPFRTESFLETADRILHAIPLPLSQVNPHVPERLAHLISRMLAKEPSARYATAADLVRELHAIRTGVAPLPWRRKISWRMALASIVIAVAVLGVLFQVLRSPPHPPLQPRWVLIGDFENRTGDEFFDNTARELLTVAIEQSRFLTVFPRARTVDTLRRMQKPIDARLDPATAREICLRENLQTLITGEVVPAGRGYRIAVRIVDPQSEMTLAALAEPLSGKQGLWDAVDRLSAKLREDLGEERSVVKRDSVPLERATTRSLEALERFSRALRLQAADKIEEAQTLMKAAVELDPEFAIAYSRLAIIQQALGAEEEALASSSHAYRLRDRVSERERYLIQANYHTLRLDFEDALEDLRTLSALYPNDATAYGNLAATSALMDKLPEAIEAARRASQLDPKNALRRANVVDWLAQAGREDEALHELQAGREMGVNGPSLSGSEAFAWLMEGDVARARQALQTMAKGGAYFENLARLYLAQLLIYEGKLEPAAEQLESDLTLDSGTGNEFYAAIRHYWLARLYLLLGRKRPAMAHLDKLLATTRLTPLGLHQLRQAGLVCVEIGDVSRGQRVLQEIEQLQSSFPSNFSKAAAAQIRGGLEQVAGDNPSALHDLRQARTLWGGVSASWSLANYWQQEGDDEKALNFYREVLDRKGDVLQWDFAGLWIVAHFQAAGCSRRLGNTKEAVRLYDEFLHLWGTEARELPQVKKAKEELGGLRPL
jgi:tetratricopeptide (TPR) repeat protein/predicted Ser/Thr protein kinase